MLIEPLEAGLAGRLQQDKAAWFGVRSDLLIAGSSVLVSMMIYSFVLLERMESAMHMLILG